ncbi:MAG: hypothetical protein F6K19_11955, partial [Cyanothece sp. SIO1E1]|nr:hypothetical protein [Cyanothece sp. SIO1E1]
MANPTIYTTGGTVQAGGGIYLSRQADQELLQLCCDSTFAYVLTPRQMGKSSLMVQTAERLAEKGIRSVIIDLTQIGTQVTADAWYLGLLTVIEDQLLLDTDVMDWWQQYQHLGVTQRLTRFFREVLLAEVSESIVVFVDEIDTTLSLDFTDDFYAAIRYLYVARARESGLSRLSFVLIGVATPGDLIRDPKRTPFNVGQRVELADFTFAEAKSLAAGLTESAHASEQVLTWVLNWTAGHPYLTQRLCQALTEAKQSRWSAAEVNQVVGRTFFGAMSERDNNLQFVRDMLTKRAPEQNQVGVLTTYQQVWRQRQPVVDEEQSLVKSHLKLSGVVKREEDTRNLRVRNGIYQAVFDRQWVRAHLPGNWWDRVKPALPLIILLTVVALAMGVLARYAFRQAAIAEERRVEAEHLQKLALDAQKEAERQGQLAIDERDKAEKERQRAEDAQKVAEQQTQIALEQRMKAEQQTQVAQQQTQIAQAQKRNADTARQAESVQKQLAVRRQREAEAATQAAKNQEQIALARQLAAQSEWARRQRGDLISRSVLLAVESRQRLLAYDVATADADQALRGLALLAPEEARMSHDGYVVAVSFSPNSQYLATASWDNTARVWDASSGQEIARMSHDGSVVAVSFSPNGQYL